MGARAALEDFAARCLAEAPPPRLEVRRATERRRER